MMEIRPALTAVEVETVRALLRDYGRIPGVGDCVAGFAAEIEALPGRYAEPDGTLLLAFQSGRAVGCGALRRLSPEICEMKRLYVDASVRGGGVGRMLVLALIEAGRARRYKVMRLDTLPSMKGAIALYGSLGFRAIERYDDRSPEQALYFELAL